jgi:hypothetical protein
MLNLYLYLYIILSNPKYAEIANLPAIASVQGIQRAELASRTFSMENRYDNEFVNGVFKDNILLNIHYMAGTVTKKEEINWETIQKPFKTEFTLNPSEGFAFQDQILPEYQKVIVKTTNAHFNFSDGFRSSGKLYGDGVCHLASFINMAAKDAGLDVNYLANHNFAKINEVPKEYGVSIRYSPDNFANSSRQNLYIVNNKEVPVTFIFEFDGTNLTVKVVEESVVRS